MLTLDKKTPRLQKQQARARRARINATSLRRILMACFAVLTSCLHTTPSNAEIIFAPRPTPTPNSGVDGATTLHGDAASSDTTPFTGPGRQKLKRTKTFLGAACPTLLQRSDGHFMVLCTSLFSRAPMVHLIDKINGKSLAQITLPAGELLNGVYAYMDNHDRVIMVDGDSNILQISANNTGTGKTGWTLTQSPLISLAPELDKYCKLTGKADGCDGVVSLSPGSHNTIWFVSRYSVVGIVSTTTHTTQSIKLSESEEIHNSLSTTADGRAAVVTDHALYLLSESTQQQPFVLWRHTYDRGSGRKPGQLSYGSGATPTFFGPTTGTDYVTITDNADGQMSLIIRDASINGSGNIICEKKLFSQSQSGTENSAIAIGRSIFVTSTYGYPYPAPAVQNAAEPIDSSTDFHGGITRIDVNLTENGCNIIWVNSLRSAAVPKLSTTDHYIYTVERRSPRKNEKITLFDAYYFVVIDAHTGNVINTTNIGWGPLDDTLQTAGNISSEGTVFWQGRLGGITRIFPK